MAGKNSKKKLIPILATLVLVISTGAAGVLGWLAWSELAERKQSKDFYAEMSAQQFALPESSEPVAEHPTSQAVIPETELPETTAAAVSLPETTEPMPDTAKPENSDEALQLPDMAAAGGQNPDQPTHQQTEVPVEVSSEENADSTRETDSPIVSAASVDPAPSADEVFSQTTTSASAEALESESAATVEETVEQIVEDIEEHSVVETAVQSVEEPEQMPAEEPFVEAAMTEPSQGLITALPESMAAAEAQELIAETAAVAGPEEEDIPGKLEAAEAQEENWDVWCDDHRHLEAGTEKTMLDFDRIITTYPDCRAWLKMEGLGLDMPVVQGEDNIYYLNHLPNKWDNESGSLMLDASCRSDLHSDVSTIHGHHLTNGSMFGNLILYNNEEFWRKYPCFTLYTPDGDYEVEIVAAATLSAADYGYPTALRTEEEFYSFLDQFYRKAPYQTGVTPQYGDRFLVLSTCAYNFENARFLVLGVLR